MHLAGQGIVDFPLSSPLPLLLTICTTAQMSKEVLSPPSDYLYHARSAEDLAALLKDDLKVRVAGLDVDGVMRGKVRLAVAPHYFLYPKYVLRGQIMSKNKFLGICKESTPAFGFCSVIFGWDIHDDVYPKELGISNKANGYGDILARIDFSTFR